LIGSPANWVSPSRVPSYCGSPSLSGGRIGPAGQTPREKVIRNRSVIMVRQVIRVPLNKIVRKQQVREHFDLDGIRALAASIQEVGQTCPVGLIPAGDLYELLYGDRRYRALEMIGAKEIEGILFDFDLAEVAKLELQLVENLARQDLNPLEAAKGVAGLMGQTNYSGDVIAQKLGLSAGYVTKLSRILQLPHPVQALVSTGKVSVTAAYTLSNVGDAAEQIALAEQVANGMTRDELAATIKRKKAPRTATDVRPSSRIRVELGQGRSITVVGADATLDGYIELLKQAIKKAQAQRPRGISLATYVKLCRDEANVETASAPIAAE
jgi:ParB/RepB/Spo0J family partition protein